MSCWDAEEVQQLINHYDGNTLLTPLELVQLALTCLRRRKTVSRSGADLAYALKGLLRRRPQTVENESGFEAFASLSLASDSQRLLERLVCALPPDPNADWSDLRDAWGMELWDFEPSTQVAGVVDGRTVLLDGAFGASVRWTKLKRLGFKVKSTPIRIIALIAVRGLPSWMLAAISILAPGIYMQALINDSGTVEEVSQGITTFLFVLGGVFLFISLMIMFTSPWLLWWLYHGKFWGTQAMFIGIEGPVELGDLERRLFGTNEGRLTWSNNGSLLSRHKLDPITQECIALTPLRQNISDVITKHSNADAVFTGHDGTSEGQPQRLFTLVDTYTLIGTQFYAFHPPSAVFICSQEGGMQRAVLCSYDWRSRTHCRETVVRMKTLVLERMNRVDRFRFAMKR